MIYTDCFVVFFSFVNNFTKIICFLLCFIWSNSHFPVLPILKTSLIFIISCYELKLDYLFKNWILLHTWYKYLCYFIYGRIKLIIFLFIKNFRLFNFIDWRSKVFIYKNTKFISIVILFFLLYCNWKIFIL